MLVCKFEINWSTNKNLIKVLTTYLGRTDRLTDGCPTFPYPPLRFAGAGDNYVQINSVNALKDNKSNVKKTNLYTNFNFICNIIISNLIHYKNDSMISLNFQFTIKYIPYLET